MKGRFSARFLSAYSDAPLEIRKKAGILLKVNAILALLMFGAATLVNGVVGGNPEHVVIDTIIVVLLVITLAILRWGRFALASNMSIVVLIGGLSVTGYMGYSGNPDVDFALLAVNLLPLMFYVCLIGYRLYQPLGAMAFSLAAVIGFFAMHAAQREWAYDLAQTAMLLNISFVTILVGAIAYNVIRVNSDLLGIAEKEAEHLQHKSQELRRAEERLLVTLRSIGDGVVTTDIDGRVVLMNRVAEELMGWRIDEARGKPLEEVFRIVNEQTRDVCENPVHKVMQSGNIVGLANHTVLIARDGTERVIADSGAPIKDHAGKIVGVVLVFRDETENRRTQQSLRSAEKLEALGVLAGGIAHDFNNLLNGLFGYIELARDDATGNPAALESLNSALGVFDRAKGLTQQLLTFSRGEKPVRGALDLTSLVRKSAEFALSGSNITPEFSISPDLWMCECDQQQIAQVVDNIVINARQAMPGGGNLRVSAHNLPGGAALPGVLQDGMYVCITIEDDGNGIPQSQLSRIFDPFFTTKKEGSGLGLATSYSIVAKHDGHIEVRSEIGDGTAFHVYLPAVDIPVGEAAPDAPQSQRGRAGDILVVDDEETNLEIAKRMLDNIGCAVTCARNSEEAIAAYSEALGSGISPQLVLLDLTIHGGPGGKEILQKLKELDPLVSAIAVSGYSNDPVMADPHAYGFVGSLKKPYRKNELYEIVDRLLSARAGASGSAVEAG